MEVLCCICIGKAKNIPSLTNKSTRSYLIKRTQLGIVKTSSSLRRADSTDYLNSLMQSVPIGHCSWCHSSDSIKCAEEKTTYPEWQSKHVCAWHVEWMVCPWEREKKRRNIVTLTPQIKIKRNLKWREFARVAYFLKQVYRPSKKRHMWEKGQVCCRSNQGKTLFLLAEVNSEDLIFW